ncbi:MAG: beta-hydroxyacyl-ACP dehydratase [Planctomycetes bacterium]|nr:beta-hydroxyacyl-ACP dehydratase [Planctomycetota bacterium]
MITGPAISSIPHRPPFLFVDEVIESQERRIVTRTFVDPGADFFRGHYPGAPVMPGVLLCECCLQAGALLLAQRGGGRDPATSIPVVTRIQDARFKHLVRPGDVLRVEVTLDDELDTAYFFTGRAYVADRLALRLTFACTLAHHGEDRGNDA